MVPAFRGSSSTSEQLGELILRSLSAGMEHLHGCRIKTIERHLHTCCWSSETPSTGLTQLTGSLSDALKLKVNYLIGPGGDLSI